MVKSLVVLALISGCSIAFQDKPTASKVATSECSTTNAYWIADSVGVGVSVAALVASFFVADKYSQYAAPGAVTSIAYLASAGNGYRAARDCRANRESLAQTAAR